MLLVGLHLWHGVSSAFQSLGMDHPAYTPKILAAGKLFAVVIAGGLFVIPLYLYFAGGRP
jgi:succinate dehydrogenase / fumarate reductase cytochrome b subunit